MGGIVLSVHPLFFLFGIYYGLTGKFFLFVTITVCAVMHELGHSFCASKAGYRLNKIMLMPFGAVVDGDTDGIKPIDEIKIALAGPLINLAVGVFFVAVWWTFPQTYAYTDIAVSTCLSLALINLIPAYPLDGGRILYALLKTRLKSRTAEKICKGVGLAFSLCLLALFVLGCVFRSVNLSLLFFALFTSFGVFGKRNAGRYVKMFSDYSTEKLKRGMVCKRQAVDHSVTLKKVVSLMDEDCINEIVVYKDGVPVDALGQEKLVEVIKNNSLYDEIGKILNY